MSDIEMIDEIDQLLFDASVLAQSGRATEADRKITAAQIQLDKLRSRHE